MTYMFKGCTAFNQPLDKWTISKVTTMSHMFDGCSNFNQNLQDWGPKFRYPNPPQIVNMFASPIGLNTSNNNSIVNAWGASPPGGPGYSPGDLSNAGLTVTPP